MGNKERLEEKIEYYINEIKVSPNEDTRKFNRERLHNLSKQYKELTGGYYGHKN